MIIQLLSVKSFFYLKPHNMDLRSHQFYLKPHIKMKKANKILYFKRIFKTSQDLSNISQLLFKTSQYYLTSCF